MPALHKAEPALTCSMTLTPPESIAPDNDQIQSLAEAAILALPDPYRVAAGLVALRVQDFADPEILEALDIEDPFELTGLYDGTPLTEKSFAEQPLQPDQIFLFRRAILDEWLERGDVSLAELVTHVFIHELAHHFGWSDDDIARIDPWWE
jgi:predicted Zn-dependent protease with MMP-like domain